MSAADAIEREWYGTPDELRDEAQRPVSPPSGDARRNFRPRDEHGRFLYYGRRPVPPPRKDRR